MSLKIKGDGIESVGNINITSHTGNINMVDAITDPPRKVKTKLTSGDIIVVHPDEALITPPLTLEGDALLCLKPGGKIVFV